LPKTVAQKNMRTNSRWRFFLHLFLGAPIFVRNFKIGKFLHILEEQTSKKNKKNCCQKREFKMAAKFKMATKTKFAM
jgi:hypothetical protein